MWGLYWRGAVRCLCVPPRIVAVLPAEVGTGRDAVRGIDPDEVDAALTADVIALLTGWRLSGHRSSPPYQSPQVHTGPHVPVAQWGHFPDGMNVARLRHDWTTGAAPPIISSQRGQPGVLRPNLGPPQVCFVVTITFSSIVVRGTPSPIPRVESNHAAYPARSVQRGTNRTGVSQYAVVKVQPGYPRLCALPVESSARHCSHVACVRRSREVARGTAGVASGALGYSLRP